MLMAAAAVATSCTDNEDSFTTAGEEDYPRILNPYFGDWTNGVPGVFRNMTRDQNLKEEVIVTPMDFTVVKWYVDDGRWRGADDRPAAACGRIYAEDRRYDASGARNFPHGATDRPALRRRPRTGIADAGAAGGSRCRRHAPWHEHEQGRQGDRRHERGCGPLCCRGRRLCGV